MNPLSFESMSTQTLVWMLKQGGCHINYLSFNNILLNYSHHPQATYYDFNYEGKSVQVRMVHSSDIFLFSNTCFIYKI